MQEAKIHLIATATLRSFTTASASINSHGNILITRLSRQGRISDARQLFDETPQPDITSWTALIAAYARAGHLRDAEILFNRPDALCDIATWTALLYGYARAGHLRAAEHFFDRMPDKNVVSWNTMIFAYAKNGMIDKALHMFIHMPVRNIASWNTMISALAQSGRIDEACKLFFQMTEKDVISWTAIVSGLSQNSRVDEAREIFDKMPQRNVVSWNAILSGYMQNQRIKDALQLFETMPEKNVASWNTIITGFMQNKDLKNGRKLFDEMHEKNVISWTAMIAGYTQEGEYELSLKTFLEMLSTGIRPNEGTYVTLLSAISSVAAHIEGLQVHQIITKTKFQFSPFVESALISMYSKCGDIGTARKVFNISNQKDLVNWNGMITAYAHHGYGQEAIQLLETMNRRGLKPNDITYIALLSACSHSGLVDKGLELFDSLVKDGSIEVRDYHYACLVDLCTRAGRLNEISGINIESPFFVVWGALLGGCNLHRNVNLAKLPVIEVLKADSRNVNAYLQMSNILAITGRWKEKEEIRHEMTERGLKKQPGCSWIQIGDKVNVFVTRDMFHAQFNAIDSMLQKLHLGMKMMKYDVSVNEVDMLTRSRSPMRLLC